RSGGHELLQIPEEGTLLVDGVEAARLLVRERGHAAGDELQAASVDHGEDLPEHAVRDGVGLHDEEGSLRHERRPAFRIAACMVTPSSAGLGAMCTPAA